MKCKIPADLSIPSFLRREVTPQSKAAVTRINNEMRRGGMRRIEKTSGPSSISAGHALNLDDAGKALLKEINHAKEAKKKQAFAHLRELADAKRREKVMSQQVIGPKEAQLQASRASTVPLPKKTPEQLAAAIRDLNGKASQKKAASKFAPKVKAKVKAKALVAPPVKKSAPAKKPLMQIAEDMLTTAKMVTQDEVNAAWKKAGGKSPSINIDALLERYKKREGGKPSAKLIETNGKFRFA